MSVSFLQLFSTFHIPSPSNTWRILVTTIRPCISCALHFVVRINCDKWRRDKQVHAINLTIPRAKPPVHCNKAQTLGSSAYCVACAGGRKAARGEAGEWSGEYKSIRRCTLMSLVTSPSTLSKEVLVALVVHMYPLHYIFVLCSCIVNSVDGVMQKYCQYAPSNCLRTNIISRENTFTYWL